MAVARGSPTATAHNPDRQLGFDTLAITRGQDGFAISFPAGLFHPLLLAGLTRRTEARLGTVDAWPKYGMPGIKVNQQRI
jgi:hypothetical protein